MKILYLITGLRVGGAEHQLLLLAENMKLQSFEVLVVAMESGGAMADRFKMAGIEVLELNITSVKKLLNGYIAFKKALNSFSPDVVHSHMIHANLFARLINVFGRKNKLISTAHNIREGSGMMMKFYRFTSFIPYWSTNVSREAFSHFVGKKYFDAKRSSYIPNAIDTNRFNPGLSDKIHLKKQLGIDENTYVLFSAGRLHEQKNYQLILRAFQLVHRKMENAVLVIAGEGNLEPYLKNLSLTLGISDKTLFLGRRDDIPELLNSCDCFVLSSTYEGFGLVIGEAMAMMKPVIATNCGGVKEVMGGFGRLINVNDVHGFASAMLATYESPSSVTDLESARRHIVESYSVPLVMKQWTQLYSN
jgi:glycosyltransferase involved in cell wall biosynthesis